jgi:LysR family hca operon transcriptional activator
LAAGGLPVLQGDKWARLAGRKKTLYGASHIWKAWDCAMELRHLRFFVAVAEEGSLTNAAEKRLHTAQPSLSRQMKDLEFEVGAQLMTRSVKGIELTPAGRAFLDHARLALAQVDAAGTAARRAAQPAKASFALGFLTGQEMDWLPDAMALLRDDLPNTDVTVSSQYSPQLADGLVRGRLDLAFMRRKENAELEYRLVTREPLVVVLPSDHRLAVQPSIAIEDIAAEPFIGMSDTAPTLQRVIEDYFRQTRIELKPTHKIDNIGMAMSLVASTRGVTLLPAYTKNFLPWSVAARPLAGEGAFIDLVVGYSKANRSAVLELFLSRLDEIVARVSQRQHLPPRHGAPPPIIS